jgi:hypothetical protein
MATPVMAFAQLATDCEKDGLNPHNGERIAAEIAKAFAVKPDEVAILRLEKTNLVFVYPAKLHNVGSIPLNTSGSVAARTASAKRAEAINNFAQVRHASVFEAVELGAHRAEVIGLKPDGTPDKHQFMIQKLMSVPVMGLNGTAAGVIQVCRKGTSGPSSGADFTPADVQKLATIAGALSKIFK